MKAVLTKLPIIGPILQRLIKSSKAFSGSEDYWIDRYNAGRTSGAGSYNELAEFKAEIINAYVKAEKVETIIEYGCGDGNQLKLAQYPAYVGFDVSPAAISRCSKFFAADNTKQFRLMKEYDNETARLTLSLDVIYHLVEDPVYLNYMHRLFDSAEAYVIIYSSDSDLQQEGQAPHVRHRKFTDWVRENKPAWKLRRHIPNRYPLSNKGKTGSLADFYCYEKP